MTPIGSPQKFNRRIKLHGGKPPNPPTHARRCRSRGRRQKRQPLSSLTFCERGQRPCGMSHQRFYRRRHSQRIHRHRGKVRLGKGRVFAQCSGPEPQGHSPKVVRPASFCNFEPRFAASQTWRPYLPRRNARRRETWQKFAHLVRNAVASAARGCARAAVRARCAAAFRGRMDAFKPLGDISDSNCSMDIAASSQPVSHTASWRRWARNRAVRRCICRRESNVPTRVAPKATCVSGASGIAACASQHRADCVSNHSPERVVAVR